MALGLGFSLQSLFILKTADKSQHYSVYHMADKVLSTSRRVTHTTRTKTSLRWILFLLYFNRRRKRGSEKLSYLFKVTQQVRGSARIWTPASRLWSWYAELLRRSTHKYEVHVIPPWLSPPWLTAHNRTPAQWSLSMNDCLSSSERIRRFLAWLI